ncbi:MAG: LON peptidase substrate-binding domain-containing protein [Solirubrobacterales bacterium]|nr:LON peptidase substrate-binding domain-containing protein [Solirubrobacterales bacterium]
MCSSYDRRIESHAPIELPIFELPVAIVPAEKVPLHIFEQRYLAMIAHCLEDVSPFGFLFRDDDGPRSIGCSAMVSEVVERHEDGRLDVVVTGAHPFAVLDRYEAPEWPEGRVHQLEIDEPTLATREPLRDARAAFAELLDAVGAQAERADAAPHAFAIAAQIEMPPDEKQALLEAANEGDRLVALEHTLRKLLAGVKRSRELGERAKTNGHSPGQIGPIR